MKKNDHPSKRELPSVPNKKWTKRALETPPHRARDIRLVDVTELRRAEESLRESEASLRGLINAVPEPALLITPEGKIIVANESMAHNLGKKVSDLIGRCAYDFLEPEYAKKRKALNDKVVQTGKPIHFEDSRSGRHFINFIYPVLDEKGNVSKIAILALDITDRKQIEAELKYRVELETIISRISTKFITLPIEKIDDAIHQALAEIGTFAGVDRCYIFQARENGITADNTHEWCAEGIASLKPFLQGLSGLSFPWWLEKLRKLEAIHIPRVLDLPPEAQAEKEFILARGNKSVIVVPLSLGENLTGFLGFDSVRDEKTWREEIISLLQIVGEIFVNALERRKSEETLKKRTEQVIRNQEALLELAKIEYSDIDSALNRITETDAQNMGVERVSIWFFNEDRSEIFCRDLYRKDSHSHEKGLRLLAKQYPRYFKALEESRVLAANDALTDLRTNEFTGSYLKPLGITSMMDIPFRLHGELAGIVCHEHTGPRREWTLEEQQFAISIGDLVSLAFESLEQKRTEKVKNSILQISEAAISSENLEELFRCIHCIIDDLMPAKNFYIALFDPVSKILSFPYFVDEYDQTPSPRPLGKGLTEYVLRTGEPLLASPEIFESLVRRGKVEPLGAPSIDWLGAPLKIHGKKIGVLVVQSYAEGIRYGKEDENILRFVSGQVAMATHRKQAEEALRASLQEKEILLREVHHRVKNNMQVISSLLNLQAFHIQDPAVLKMFQESRRRIRSMALVHELLYQSSDLSRIEFSEYLRHLAIHLFHSCEVDSNLIQLDIKAENVLLNINTAIPCGLILNELISNSLKHAFPGGRAGTVTIELHQTDSDQISLSIRDDGVGFPGKLDLRKTKTLGMQIVTTLVAQIEGRIVLNRSKGTEFVLHFRERKFKQKA